MNYLLLAVLVMAIVTYIPRVMPLVLVNRKIESKFINSFLYYLPYSVLGAMTFPSVLFSTGNLYFSIIGTIIALILAYLGRGLMTVTIGAVTVVILCEFIF